MNHHQKPLRHSDKADNVEGDNDRGYALASDYLKWTPFEGPELFTMMCRMSAAGLEPGYLAGASWCKPPFYQSGVLVRPDNKRGMFVYAGNEMVMLSGASDDIRRANDLAGLNINTDTAIGYMTFFSENLQTMHNNFSVVHEGDQVNFPDGKAVEIEYPTRIEALSLRKHFMKAMVVWSNDLFRAILYCDESGSVEMIDDDIIGAVHYTPGNRPGPQP